MNLNGIHESKRDETAERAVRIFEESERQPQLKHQPDIERAELNGWPDGWARGPREYRIVQRRKLNPLVYANRAPPGKPTAVLRNYDVQPAETLKLWTSPAFATPNPQAATVRPRHSDDKGHVHHSYRALDAIIKTAGKLPINLKVWWKGKERQCEPLGFGEFNKARLKAEAELSMILGCWRRRCRRSHPGCAASTITKSKSPDRTQRFALLNIRRRGCRTINQFCASWCKMKDHNFRVTVPGFLCRRRHVIEG